MPPATPRLLVLAAALCLASCSGHSDNGPGGNGSSGHTALPQVNDNGGGILTAVEVVTVTYEPSLYTNVTSPAPAQLVTDLQAFDDSITQTAWWDTVRAGYCEPVGSSNCVGRGTTLPASTAHVSIATAPASSYTDSANGGPATIKPYITGLMQDGTVPAPDANTLYVFYFPASTTITSDGQVSCQIFGGYHNSVSYGGADVPYAVVPICDPEVPSKGVTPLDHEQTATFAASHEIIESATDPHVAESAPASAPFEHVGYYLTDPASQAWSIVLGGAEIADLCVDIAGLGQDRWTEGQWTVQRVWNNISAAGNHDPCVPIPSGEVYFNVAPPKADEEIQLSVGGTQSYDGIAFADGSISGWTVEVVDLGATSTGAPTGILTASPTKANATDGASIPIAITLAKALTTPIQGDPPFEPFAIVSLGTGNTYHLWPGLVLSPQ